MSQQRVRGFVQIHPTPTGDDLAALLAKYQGGATLREIAADRAVDESTVRRWIGKAIPRRTVGPRPNPASTREIVALRNAGLSWETIAAQVGMSRTGVRHRYGQYVQAIPTHWEDTTMARMPMKNRSIKVSDAAWDAAQAAADQRGEVLSEEIRKFLERYGKPTTRRS